MPSGKFQAQRSVSPGRGAFAFEAHAILKLRVGMLSPLSDLFAGVTPALEVAEPHPDLFSRPWWSPGWWSPIEPRIPAGGNGAFAVK